MLTDDSMTSGTPQRPGEIDGYCTLRTIPVAVLPQLAVQQLARWAKPIQEKPSLLANDRNFRDRAPFESAHVMYKSLKP